MGSGIFFSHGTNHEKAVCILLSSKILHMICPSYDPSVDSHNSDTESRIVVINLIFKRSNLLFVAFMPPINRMQQLWNVSTKKCGAQWKPSTYRDKLLFMIEELNISAIFRTKNSSKKSYTYESKFLKVKSRMDFFSGVKFHY